MSTRFDAEIVAMFRAGYSLEDVNCNWPDLTQAQIEGAIRDELGRKAGQRALEELVEVIAGRLMRIARAHEDYQAIKDALDAWRREVGE